MIERVGIHYPLILGDFHRKHRKNLELEMAERMQIESALRGIEKKYRVIFELSPEAVLLLDREGNVLDANERLHKWLGYRPEEVIGKNLLKIPAFPAESIKAMERFSRQESGQPSGEINFISKSGEKRVWRMFSSAIKDEGGEVQRLVMIADITENKAMVEAIKSIPEREAQAYAQGRREIINTIINHIGNAINSVNAGTGTIQENLANNRLTRHLLSLANAIKEHEDDFAEYVGNDPQGQKVAPLTIALADEFAKRDERMAQIANRVYERGRRVAALIRREGEFDSGSAYRKEVNPEKAINDAIAALEDSISERRIGIAVDCSGAPETINIQERLLNQVLMDLIENSIEAIDHLETWEGMRHTPFIKIKCSVESGSIVLDITDNGVGIERDELELIFKAGYSAKPAENRPGLHSAANLIKGCGGQIQVLSDGIDADATTRIEIPMHSPILV